MTTKRICYTLKVDFVLLCKIAYDITYQIRQNFIVENGKYNH